MIHSITTRTNSMDRIHRTYNIKAESNSIDRINRIYMISPGF